MTKPSYTIIKSYSTESHPCSCAHRQLYCGFTKQE